MQHERLTSSTDTVLAKIRQIPPPGDLQGHAGHIEKSANGPETKNTEQMEAR